MANQQYKLDKFHSKLKGVAIVGGARHIKINFAQLTDKDYVILEELGIATKVKEPSKADSKKDSPKEK